MSPVLIMEVLNRIEKKTLELYGRYGVKAMTMDDVARSCGISKKTLYENFANKKELVEDIVQKMTAKLKNKYSFTVAHAKDAISEVLLSLNGLEQFYRNINYIMIEDLEKYYYETWDGFSKFRNEVGLGLITANIERGIKEGVFHEKFDIEIIAKLRLAQLDRVHKEAHSGINLHDSLYQVTLHFLYGLATDKGRQLLEKYTEEQTKANH